MRRQAFPPVFPVELEPGAAAELATEIGFPFDSTAGISAELEEAIEYVHANRTSIADERQAGIAEGPGPNWLRRSSSHVVWVAMAHSPLSSVYNILLYCLGMWGI